MLYEVITVRADFSLPFSSGKKFYKEIKKMTDRSEITLYSGGHKGAETEFGKHAECWGLKEVNFSFLGHAIERTRGMQVLPPEELEKGDISMEIVSRRMGRNYAKAEKIRKVIQSIFHMVNNGSYNFV